MSVIGSNILAGASGQGGGYNLTRSLRFRSSASAYLNRTPASAGNRQTWTWSAWVKRGSLGSTDRFLLQTFGAGGFGVSGYIRFNSDDTMKFFFDYNGGSDWQLTTTQVFRDPSAWYHVVVVADTTNATSSNRLRLYINGSQVTTFASSNYPSQNANGTLNQAYAHYIGQQNSTNYFDGYLTEVNFIDGQALTPSSFGETSTTTGVWIPKRYTGTYGTNGFYLPFSDNTSTTTLGADSSGNGNNWTCNNISLTSGSTYDSMVDVPTQPTSSSDTYPPSNYAVFNPIAPASQTNSEANLKVSTAAVNATPATIFPSSGKWYAEIALVSGTYHRVGICNTDGIAKDLGGSANGWCYLSDGRIYNNGSTTSYGVSSTNGDIINIALDLDAGKIWYGKNGTWMSSGSPSTGANPSQTFTANQSMSFAVASGSGTIVYTGNFGQRPFAYTPPTGFVALNTFNLPTPTIGATASSQANKYFDATLYTGTGSAQSIVNAGGFQPALVWAKSRSNAYPNVLSNLVVGATKYLVSNNTDAETTDAGYISAINSNGFSVGSSGGLNVNGGTFVGWQWKGNGSGSSNTAGSITSTVSANTTSGFSVVTYTGTGSGATVGHGLGVKPAMIIFKNRGSAYNWRVWHQSLSSQTQSYLSLNLTNAVGTDATIWNNTAPTSTVFSVGADASVNESSKSTVAYCFAEVAGFSKFGSYTGNGSTDGAFVYTGFRPKYLMVKLSSNAGGNWVMVDTSRNPSNVTNLSLDANQPDAEQTGSSSTMPTMDLLSNGFKIRTTSIGGNGNGYTYIYMAFAENPFKYSLAR